MQWGSEDKNQRKKNKWNTQEWSFTKITRTIYADITFK